jgi:catalase
MRVDGNHGSTLGYEPNSYGEWQEQPGYREPPLASTAPPTTGTTARTTDYYSQPGALFRLMSADQQQVLFENTARSIGEAPKEIKLRHIRNLRVKADPAR